MTLNKRSINVVISDDDQFFCDGLMLFLKDFYHREYDQSVTFEFNLNEITAKKADVIIKTLVAGEERLCMPALRCWTQGLLVFIREYSRSDLSRKMKCIDNSVVISRMDTLRDIETKIRAGLSDGVSSELHYYSNCLSCRLRSFSHQQTKVIEGITAGKSAECIAEDLNIHVKTVFAHKYHAMGKFGLHSDYELLRFYDSYRNSMVTLQAPKGAGEAISGQEGGGWQ